MERTMVTWSEKEAAIKALEHGGRVDPDRLIEAARSPDHPCHADFTWDVEQAAAERLRDQARSLIRRVQFEVVTEDVTERVVMYVPTEDEDVHSFSSLPKIRRASTVSAVVLGEVAQLHGIACRVYGIAMAKRGMVGDGVVDRLQQVRDSLAALKSELGAG